jgi:hypothetical protein
MAVHTDAEDRIAVEPPGSDVDAAGKLSEAEVYPAGG